MNEEKKLDEKKYLERVFIIGFIFIIFYLISSKFVHFFVHTLIGKISYLIGCISLMLLGYFLLKERSKAAPKYVFILYIAVGLCLVILVFFLW